MSGLKGNQKKGSDGKFVANPATKPLRSLKGVAPKVNKDDWAANLAELAQSSDTARLESVSKATGAHPQARKIAAARLAELNPVGNALALRSVQATLDAHGLGDLYQPKSMQGLSNWTLEVTGEVEHSRGVSWVGTLTHTSGAVITVENLGDGAENHYDGDKATRDLFEADASATFPDDFDAADSLVLCLDILNEN